MVIEDNTLKNIRLAKLVFGLCIAISCFTLLSLPLYLPGLIKSLSNDGNSSLINSTYYPDPLPKVQEDSFESMTTTERIEMQDYAKLRAGGISSTSIAGLLIGLTLMLAALQLIALVSGMKEIVSLLSCYILLSLLIMAYLCHRLTVSYGSLTAGIRFLSIWLLFWNVSSDVAGFILIRLVLYKRTHYAFDG